MLIDWQAASQIFSPNSSSGSDTRLKNPSSTAHQAAPSKSLRFSRVHGLETGKNSYSTICSSESLTFISRYGYRILISMIGLVIAIIGVLLIVALPLSNNSGRLAGYYLTQAAPTPFVAILSLLSSNVAGYTKKTTVAAMYLIGYCAGNIIGPQTFKAKDAPRYVPAEITIIATWSLGLAIMAFIHVYCVKQNRKKEAVRNAEGYVKLENQEWLDLTDKENPEFVYTL